jgi:hypothetical protein
VDLALVEGGLVHAGRRVDDLDVRGFHERFDPWRARVWLEVAGPGWSVPIDEGYADLRRSLRTRFRDRPYTADWSREGAFPALVLGGAPAPWFVAACVVVLATVVAAGVGLGPWAGVIAALAWAWPLGRVRPAIVVSPTGLRLGPAWVAEVPWHEIEAVRVTVSGRAVRLRAVTPHGVAHARVPRATWPACRARLRRLGGLVPEEVEVDTDERYAAWRAWAVGLPWGVLAGVLIGGALAPSPFLVWAWGGLAAAGLGFVGAAVEARLQGWRAGGIVWMTAAYALLLAGLILAAVRA